MNKRTIAKWSS